jgi:hypothetical protein
MPTALIGSATKPHSHFGAFPLRSIPASAHSHLGAFPLGTFSRLGRGRRRDEAVPLRPRLRGRKVLTALMSTGTQSTHITPEVRRVSSECPLVHAGTHSSPEYAASRSRGAHIGTGTRWTALGSPPTSRAHRHRDCTGLTPSPAFPHRHRHWPTRLVAHIGTGSATQQRSSTCCNNERLLQLLRCVSTPVSTSVSTREYP